MNADPRKRQLKIGGKALWHFYLSVLYTFPNLAAGLKTAAHIPSVGTRSLITEGEKLLHLCILTYLGSSWRTDARFLDLFHLIQNLFEVQKWWPLIENTVRQIEKNFRCLGQKIMADSCNRPPRSWEGKPGKEFLWEIRAIRNASIYMGEFRKTYAYMFQDRTHDQERLEKTLNWLGSEDQRSVVNIVKGIP